MLHAEVMAVGDELTSGERLDTNSQWLSRQLGEIGVPVSYHTTVGDDLPSLTSAIEIALRRAGLVIITGGLGPTADDLTRDAVAAATGWPLELRADALAAIEARFGRRGHAMPAQNRVQAMFPAGSRVVENPHGTAPGIDLAWSDQERSSRLFALPGVPAEMSEMWRATVRPAVIEMAGPGRVICHRCIKCFGTGESHLESLLPDLIRRGRDPRVGITVHRATITLRVTASGPDRSAACERMEPTIETIRACLGELVFGEEEDELEDVVIRLLRQRGQTLAVCEVGTQGIIARWLNAAMSPDRLGSGPQGDVDSSSARDRAAAAAGGPAEVFRAGLVVPSREALEALLGDFAPDDPEAQVEAAAERLRVRCGTDLALVTGPRPDLTAERPRIAIELADRQRVHRVTRAYAGHPDVVLERAAKQALDLLRIYLLNGTIR